MLKMSLWMQQSLLSHIYIGMVYIIAVSKNAKDGQ